MSRRELRFKRQERIHLRDHGFSSKKSLLDMKIFLDKLEGKILIMPLKFGGHFEVFQVEGPRVFIVGNLAPVRR